MFGRFKRFVAEVIARRSRRLARETHAALSAIAAARVAGPGRLAGRVAVVTGGASGIGRATAELFARQGARVVIADRDERAGKELAVALGDSALFLPCDVARDESPRYVVETAVSQFGGLHVLVNCAGVDVPGGVETLTPEAWDRALAVNLTGVYHSCRHALPAVVRSGGGAVVNVASVQGSRGFQLSAGYAASKGGVLALTRQLARDYAGRVRVNAVSPGLILTPMLAGRDPDALSDFQPVGHVGAPEDVALAILFLASDEAQFITGVDLPVDGGLSGCAGLHQ